MTTHSTLQQFHIRNTATALFQQRGFESVTMTDIAKAAAVDEQTVFTYYGTKFDILLQLYQCINADWHIAVENITETKLHARFEKAMHLKLERMQPHCDMLAGIMGYLLRNDQIGINSHRTAHIRHLGLSTIQQLIDGAEDGRKLKEKIKHLPSTLYLLHWTLLLLHVQGNDTEGSHASIALAARMLRKTKQAAFLLPIFPFLKDLGNWSHKMVGDADQSTQARATAILKQVFQHRKLIQPEKKCQRGDCEECINLHLPKVLHFVAAEKPIHFVLPAFPAKSPNHQKTIGKLPDLAEEIAIQTLQSLCDEIQAIHPPGAKVTICSDGRIFSTLVGVEDAEITAYVAHLRNFIQHTGIRNIEVLNLEDLLPELPIDQARRSVLEEYSEPLDRLHDRLTTSPSFLQLFNGIHRFITEDRLVLNPHISPSKTKETAKGIALQVIQHSNAWTRFLTQLYPEALRLSIHPYAAHSEKIGIRLTKAMDNWLTPWHGAIVLQEDGYMLMKSREAIAQGARLVTHEGRPHHFTTISL
jgi:pyoverdine/dityrosine biosynthesis protein Dit1/AcrR family transcriptional regulator